MVSELVGAILQSLKFDNRVIHKVPQMRDKTIGIHPSFRSSLTRCVLEVVLKVG